MARSKKRSNQGFSVIRRGRRYSARFKDHRGAWQWLTAYTDADASLELARKARRLCERRAAGLPPGDELGAWVNVLDDGTRQKLMDYDVIDRRASMVTLPLVDHVREWKDSILRDGRTADHAALVAVRVTAIVDGCGAVRFADIDAEAVKDWLSRQTLSQQTRGHYVVALRAFCTWMVEHGRAAGSPVSTLRPPKVTDRRERRALSIEDLRKLIQTTEADASSGRKMTGPQRAALYHLAVESGLRADELRSLTAASFDLDADPPTVTIEAARAKNRRRHALALSGELAARLKAHLAGKLPGAAAFAVPTKTADMIRADLVRAGIPFADDAGRRFDFHALRVQCASLLARGGAHPAVAQARLRHSTIRLTMDTYTRLSASDQAAAVDAMPSLNAAKATAAKTA